MVPRRLPLPACERKPFRTRTLTGLRDRALIGTDYMSLILQRLGKSSLGMAKKLGLLALSDSIKVVIAKKYCRGLQLIEGDRLYENSSF